MPRWDTKDETLKNLATEHSIPYIKSQNINSKEFINEVSQFGCDIFVSMSFNQIFKSEIINLPPLKTINCHAGKLPFYRGRNVLNWALINDEKEFGITVHYIDEGIDTGDIILQRCYKITETDTYNTLLEKAYMECAEILYESLKMLAITEIEPIKQLTISPVGFYCSQRKEGDEIIDWNQNSREIFNFIRAICRPAVIATSYINDKEIKINSATTIQHAPKYKGIVGAVVGIDNDGFVVKTKDSTIKITEYDYDGKIKIGDRLK